MYQSSTKPKVQVEGHNACSSGLTHYMSYTDVNISLPWWDSPSRDLHQAGLIFNQNILEYKKFSLKGFFSEENSQVQYYLPGAVLFIYIQINVWPIFEYIHPPAPQVTSNTMIYREYDYT